MRLLVYISIILFFSCTVETKKTNKAVVTGGYDYENPSRVIDLPIDLFEISGHVLINDSTIMCVQDEDGIAYEYCLTKDQIVAEYPFAGPDDYEDVAFDGSKVYVLRSDGFMYSFSRKGFVGEVKQYSLNFIGANLEGFVYNSFSKEFLFASKEPLEKNHERTVFTSQNGNIQSVTKYISINNEDIRKFLANTVHKNELMSINCNPSAIAIHPKNGYLYVLSAESRLVLVYNKTTLLEVHILPDDIYFKPEGISFFDNGDMIISSEGIKRGVLGGQLFIMKQVKI